MNNEEYKKALEENQPKIIEKLDFGPGEIVFSKLDDGERFQVITRYLNDICSITKSMLQITADQYVIIEFLCKKLGVDVAKEKRELAEKIQKQQEEELSKVKEEIKKAIN